jgi:hypothetical protein
MTLGTWGHALQTTTTRASMDSLPHLLCYPLCYYSLYWSPSVSSGRRKALFMKFTTATFHWNDGRLQRCIIGWWTVQSALLPSIKLDSTGATTTRQTAGIPTSAPFLSFLPRESPHLLVLQQGGLGQGRPALHHVVEEEAEALAVEVPPQMPLPLVSQAPLPRRP